MGQLHTIADRVRNVTVANCLPTHPSEIYKPEYADSFNVDGWFFAPQLRKAHANGNMPYTLGDVQVRVADVDYLIKVDFLDQGRSDRMDGPFDQAIQAEAVLALLDHLKLDKACLMGISYGGEVALRFAVVGWSMGGCVAMQYAMDHGDQFTGMILINPGSPYGFGGTKGADGEMPDPPGPPVALYCGRGQGAHGGPNPGGAGALRRQRRAL